MIPGMGRMDPKQMQKMMQQLGIKSQEIPAVRVIIEQNGKKIIIEQPNVTAIEMQGQKTYTIMGKEKIEENLSEEDIVLVAEQANVSKEIARKALEENDQDIAKAITLLKK
ncbi:MAG: nascent polypeptide-associated complex protein [Candidatus Diapherotrites archaeon]|nr:nascent polypeptide-associated complex protein [Candidatus Diapherotrites archaeon]